MISRSRMNVHTHHVGHPVATMDVRSLTSNDIVRFSKFRSFCARSFDIRTYYGRSLFAEPGTTSAVATNKWKGLKVDPWEKLGRLLGCRLLWHPSNAARPPQFVIPRSKRYVPFPGLGDSLGFNLNWKTEFKTPPVFVNWLLLLLAGAMPEH